MNKQELTYWVTLSLLPTLWTKRKNEIYVRCFMHDPQISIIDLFETSAHWVELGLTNEEIELFMLAHDQLANNSFLVDDLLSQGYDIIPLHSEDYPKILKSNLGTAAPTVIFTKGNKALLQAATVGIVGSRSAEAISLHFADNIARRCAGEGRVVVSGFAKGIDRQALDSVLAAGGQSIIVLPQGITTFTTGYRQYFRYIAQGRVLVMSTFAPMAPWSTDLAMARNGIIYAMASQIYVAQSDDKGGTWSGAINGLRRKRPVYVRWPEPDEKNANIQLVQKGGVPVDINGTVLDLPAEATKSPEEKEREVVHSTIVALLRTAERCTVKDILSRLTVSWTETKVKRYLDEMTEVERIKVKNRIYYRLKNDRTLFDEE